MGFKDDIEQAKSKLEKRRAELLQQISEIDVELKDYETALRVALKITGFTPIVTVSTQTPTTSESESEPTQDVVEFSGSMKDLALEILKSRYPRGFKASGIRHVARTDYDINLNPNTLTVSLGRLKASGDVRIIGRGWYYTPKKSAPPADADGALDSGGSA